MKTQFGGEMLQESLNSLTLGQKKELFIYFLENSSFNFVFV